MKKVIVKGWNSVVNFTNGVLIKFKLKKNTDVVDTVVEADSVKESDNQQG